MSTPLTRTKAPATEGSVVEPKSDLAGAKARIVELECELSQRSRAEAELRASEEKYRTLVESSPYCIKLIDGDGNLLSMNRSGLEMINERRESDIIGRHYLKVVSRQDRDRVSALLDKALAGESSEFEFMATVGRYFHSNFIPLVESDGRVTRLLSITQDVTDRRRLVSDLDHRVKNNLAAVLALSEQTRRSAKSLDDFTSAFDGRIHALARSHEALAHSHWKAVELRKIVELAIDAHMPLASGRVQIDGDTVLLPARACGPITLTLHEMVTNAVKYGAFSIPKGRVILQWSVGEDQSLEMRWTELGGPPPTDALLTSGLGINLIRGFIEHELHGSFDLDIPPTGLDAHMTIPLARL